MTKRFLTLFFVIGFASTYAIEAQSPAPGESPAGAPSPAKHRTHKKAETTASSTEAATSPSPAASPQAKRTRKKTEATEAAASASPAASPEASPKAKRGRKKAEAGTAASAAASPSPSKFSLGDLFKPKSSAAASPTAVSGAPAKSTSTETATNPPAAGGGHGLVWVNTDSHVYHREGSRFYGTTKKGKYMTEADAVKEGDRAASKGQ
jgi:membrane protein involved in colicin uptake